MRLSVNEFLITCVADYMVVFFSLFFFFNDTAPTEIYPLPLHDALPISTASIALHCGRRRDSARYEHRSDYQDRKSTRLNSSHLGISYAVFCLKKKNNHTHNIALSRLLLSIARESRVAPLVVHAHRWM